jgi:hypothetical protein
MMIGFLEEWGIQTVFTAPYSTIAVSIELYFGGLKHGDIKEGELHPN